MTTRRSARRFRRGKREFIWTSVLFENVSPAITSGTTTQLVAPVDWIRNSLGSSFQKGCVLQTIRGWLDICDSGKGVTDSAGTGNVNVYGVIWKSEVDEDFSTFDWGQSDEYNSEDLLWVGGASLPGSANLPAAGVQLQQPQRAHLEFNVRTKRKLNSDEAINLTVTTGAAPGTSFYSGVIRSLLTLP